MFIPKENLNMDVLYTDFYLFFVILLSYGSMIFANKIYPLEVAHFKSLIKYILYKIKIFSFFNALLLFGITLSNYLILLVNSINVSGLKILHYTVHYFIIFELLYFLCLSLEFFRNNFFKKCFAMFLFAIMYIVGILNGSNSFLAINIFDAYLSFRMNYTNYIVWFLIPIFILYNKKEVFEL